MTLNQLDTSDPEGAAAFYRELLGWDVALQDTGGAPEYWGIFNGGALNGGMMRLPPGVDTPHWLVYFGAGDADATVARVEALGGGVMAGPMDVPSGRIAAVHDPQGAAFALLAGRFDP
jgi:predicted enzyme related to lactoylglutathione lyase